MNRKAVRQVLAHKSSVVSALGITQMLAWASTYYLTALFADPVSLDLHLARTWFYGAVSAALLLSGLLAPIAGRMIDRHGGRDVLALTNLTFTAGLMLLSFATGPITLVLAWLVLGIGMGFGLYEAAFATVAGLYGQEARNAITGIYLVRRLRQHRRLAGKRVVHQCVRLPHLSRAVAVGVFRSVI